MFDLNEDVAYETELRLRELGFGSWSAECAVRDTLRYTDLCEVLVLLLGAPAFKGSNVDLSEDGDSI